MNSVIIIKCIEAPWRCTREAVLRGQKLPFSNIRLIPSLFCTFLSLLTFSSSFCIVCITFVLRKNKHKEMSLRPSGPGQSFPKLPSFPLRLSMRMSLGPRSSQPCSTPKSGFRNPHSLCREGVSSRQQVWGQESDPGTASSTHLREACSSGATDRRGCRPQHGTGTPTLGASASSAVKWPR